MLHNTHTIWGCWHTPVSNSLISFTGLVNATSKHFDGGTSLHIAAANLSLQAARTLVKILSCIELCVSTIILMMCHMGYFIYCPSRLLHPYVFRYDKLS